MKTLTLTLSEEDFARLEKQRAALSLSADGLVSLWIGEHRGPLWTSDPEETLEAAE